MGVVMPETCWAYKKYNKIISDIYLGFLFFSYPNDARSNKHQIRLVLWHIFIAAKARLLDPEDEKQQPLGARLPAP